MAKSQGFNDNIYFLEDINYIVIQADIKCITRRKTEENNMKLLEKFKKTRNDKGFTLVELIVVLVILAILAAILVPALLGYIDKAKDQQDVLNAKSCLTAAQAKFSELYASDYTLPASGSTLDSSITNDIEKMADANIKNLTVGTTASTSTDATAIAHANYTITYVAYLSNKTGAKTIYFDGSKWGDTAPTTAPSATYVIK